MLVNGLCVDRNEFLSLHLICPVTLKTQRVHFPQEIVTIGRGTGAKIKMMDKMGHVHPFVIKGCTRGFGQEV